VRGCPNIAWLTTRAGPALLVWPSFLLEVGRSWHHLWAFAGAFRGPDCQSVKANSTLARYFLRPNGTENRMTQELKGSERRRSQRVWLRRGGQLILVKGMRSTESVPCKVLNTSRGGALIKVEGSAADVPDDFYLTIAGQADKRLICSVVRRGRQLLGVRFIQQADYQVHVWTSHV
jgi:hypothetical protein